MCILSPKQTSREIASGASPQLERTAAFVPTEQEEASMKAREITNVAGRRSCRASLHRCAGPDASARSRASRPGDRDDPRTGDGRKRRDSSGRDGHAQKPRAAGSEHVHGHRRAWRIPPDAAADWHLHRRIRVVRVPDPAVERDSAERGILGEAGPGDEDRRAGRDGDRLRADSARGRHAGLHSHHAGNRRPSS